MEPLFDQRRYLIPFRSSLLPQIFTDTLVIGAGVAGLRAAIAAGDHGEVIVLSKADTDQTNTAWAQGGIAGVLGTGADSVAEHVSDTLRTGAGLCDDRIVRQVVAGAAARLEELFNWGMKVDRGEGGRPLLGREGGHSAARIIHARGDATGAELERCLLDRFGGVASARLFEGCFALDLITPSDSIGEPVLGAITYHRRYGLQMIWAKATILAAGGAGMLYRETSNPRVTTADGLAMAYRAGATVADMAFVQFHPTALYLAGAPRLLISEAVRGEGAHLLDVGGQRFMSGLHPQAELAPRDIVSQAIVRQIHRQGGRHVWLDCRHVTGFAKRFPSITAQLRPFDLDPATDLIPVHPAAHYAVGGVRCDASGRTDVPGLYAIGEASCSGLHGANRLASNSLLEGLVMGEAAGAACAEMRTGATGDVPTVEWRAAARGTPVAVVSDIRPSGHGELDLSDVRSSLRSAMWRNVGVLRAGMALRDAADMFDFWGRYTLDKIFDDPEGWETQNMLLAGALVARSASWREESRGCHAREDFDGPSDRFAVHDLWKRGQDGARTAVVAAGESAEVGA